MPMRGGNGAFLISNKVSHLVLHALEPKSARSSFQHLSKRNI